MLRPLLWGVVISCWLAMKVYGQQKAPYAWENQLIPPSPEAAAFSKVDLTTTVNANGRVPVSIPLYTLVAAGLSMPVQLLYTGGSGIRVNEAASNVGLGWVLDAGGVISVTVHGRADLAQDAYKSHRSFHAPLTLRNALGELSCSPTNASAADQAQFLYAADVDAGSVDSQPDEFNLKLPGAQTTFALDSTGVCHSVPLSNFRITLVGNRTQGYHFEVVDPSGNRYFFDVAEGTSTTTKVNGYYVRPTTGAGYTSAYYLSKIVNPVGEVITFSYDRVRYKQPLGTDLEAYEFTRCNDPKYAPNNQLLNDALTERQQFIGGQRLIAIQSSVGRVDFHYDAADRLDIPGTNRLAGLTITNSERLIIKQITLTHDYFLTPNYATADTATKALHARLKLVQVREDGRPPYVFYYNQRVPTPARLSFAQDHFGYYNGQIGNQNLVGDLGYSHAAIRNPDSLRCRFALLEAVRYPTGGKEQIIYEAPVLVTTAQVQLDILHEEANVEAAAGGRAHQTMILHSSRNRNIVWFLPNQPGCRSTVSIIQQGGKFQFHAYGTTGGTTMFMPRGTYSVNVSNGGCQADGAQIRVGWDSVFTAIRTTRELLYGTRCKRLKYYNFANKLVKTTSFAYQGVQHTAIQPYRRNLYKSIIDRLGSGTVGLTHWYVCTWIAFMSSQVYSLGFPEAPVYYTHIEQFQDSAQVQGKTAYTYRFNNDETTALMPGLLPTSYSWLRGQLLRVDQYAQVAGAYVPQKTTEYTYRLLHNPTSFWAFQTSPAAWQDVNILGVYVRKVLNGAVGSPYPCDLYDYGYYKFPSAVQYLSKEVETLYSPAGNHQTTKRYYVTNFQHLLPSVTTTRFSDQDSISTRISYPTDFSAGSPPANAPARAILGLRTKGILNVPIEEVVYRKNHVIQGTLFEYWPTATPQLRKTYRTQLADISAVFSPAQLTNGLFQKDPQYYEQLSYDLYDGLGKALQITANQQQSEAYLWDDAHNHLVAVIHNARYPQVAATSFEPGATGRWRYDSTGTHRQQGVSRTGHWAYQLDGQRSISRTQLPAGTYELTFWVRSSTPPQLQLGGGRPVGNGLQLVATTPDNWSQFRTQIAFSSPGQLSLDVPAGGPAMLLDEILLYPLGAQLTSYTYETGVGLLSQSAPGGHLTTYEYDAQGRLVRARDEQGRILAQQQYHYARP